MLAVVDRYTRILERERERERPAPIAQKPAGTRLTMRKRAATIEHETVGTSAWKGRKGLGFGTHRVSTGTDDGHRRAKSGEHRAGVVNTQYRRAPTTGTGGQNRRTRAPRLNMSAESKHGRPPLNRWDQERDTGHGNQSALQGGGASHMLQILACGRAGPTHNPEPHRDRDTEFARNERGGSRGRHRKYSGNIAAR